MVINSIGAKTNVIPNPQPTRRDYSFSFKSQEVKADTLEKTEEKKDGFFKRNKGTVGLLAGMILGDHLADSLITNKLKNPSLLKELAIGVPISVGLGFLGYAIAGGNLDKNSK